MSQLIALVQMVDDDHSFYIADVPEAAAKTEKALLQLVETKVYGMEQVESVEVYRAELVRTWFNPDPEKED
jgi:hypothetical protein